MFVFVFVGELFKFSAATPALEPLFQLPPRMNARALLGHVTINSILHTGTFMGHLDTGSFTQVVALKTLAEAQRRAMAGKRNNNTAAQNNYIFMSELLQLRRELINGTYAPQPYRKRIITEPKVRHIEAPAFRDRIVHHAVHSVLSPFYERHFIRDSYACRPGKGTHRAMARVQHFLRSNPNLYVLQLDISKYYGSINHAKLKELLARRIIDTKLQQLLAVIIDSTDSGHEYDELFPPTSYYHTKGRRGIPIGNLTSQLFANIYLHEADMFAKQHLHAMFYIRYMDDILMFHPDKEVLRAWQRQMTTFLYEALYLTVNPRKVRLYPAKDGVSFVGYTIYPFSRKVRGSSVRRFRKRFHKRVKGYLAGTVPKTRLEDMSNAWAAHVAHGSGQPLAAQIQEEMDAAIFVRYVQTEYKKAMRAKRRPPS